MAKKEQLDDETLALIHWCDMFYEGLTPEQAAKEALA